MGHEGSMHTPEFPNDIMELQTVGYPPPPAPRAGYHPEKISKIDFLGITQCVIHIECPLYLSFDRLRKPHSCVWLEPTSTEH